MYPSVCEPCVVRDAETGSDLLRADICAVLSELCPEKASLYPTPPFFPRSVEPREAVAGEHRGRVSGPPASVASFGGVDSVGLVVGGRSGGAEAAVAAEGAAAGGAGAVAVGSTVAG